MSLVSSISYAHIAAGSRADSEATSSQTPESKSVSPSATDATPVAAEESKENTVSAEKLQSKDTSAEAESKPEASGKLDTADAVASTPAIDAAEESSAPAAETEGEKKADKKTQKKAQLNLAPAPVPTVSAWGKTVKAAPTKPLAAVKVDEDASKWPSPLSAIKEASEATSASTSNNNTKKPIAKTSGKEKWVPYEASVVISSSSSSGKPNKSHNKRTNRKKNIIPSTANGASVNNNSGKPGKAGSAAAKVPKRKVSETKRDDGSKSSEKDAKSASTFAPSAGASKTDALEGESAATTSIVPSSVNKDDSATIAAKSAEFLESDQTEKSLEETYAQDGASKAKKDDAEKNEAKLNGVDRQNTHREYNHNNHYNNYNNNNTSGNFHHTKNARYIRANYQPYKGKPHGNKHYYNNHSNNGSHHHSGEFKHSNANHNGNGYVPFKQQQVPFVQGFIPQGGFKSHPPPPPFVPFYPPYGFYNGGDINGLPFPVPNPKLGGKNYNQQRYFNNASGFVPGAAPIINPANTDEQLKAIINQISYYFSTENLVKDIFLRKQMNSNGFIPIPVIANFFRVQNLSGGNYDLVLQAIEKIDFIEVKNEKVRLQQDFQQWVLPATERSENGKDESESETTESSKSVDEAKQGVENLQVKE